MSNLKKHSLALWAVLNLKSSPRTPSPPRDGWGDFDDWDPLHSAATNEEDTKSNDDISKDDDDLDLLMKELELPNKSQDDAPTKTIPIPSASAAAVHADRDAKGHSLKSLQSWDDFGLQLNSAGSNKPPPPTIKASVDAVFFLVAKSVDELQVFAKPQSRDNNQTLQLVSSIGLYLVQASERIACFSFVYIDSTGAPFVFVGTETGNLYVFNLHGIVMFKLLYTPVSVLDISDFSSKISVSYTDGLLIDINKTDLMHLVHKFSGSMLVYCEPRPARKASLFKLGGAATAAASRLICAVPLADIQLPIGSLAPLTNQHLLHLMEAPALGDLSLTAKLSQLYLQTYAHRYAVVWLESNGALTFATLALAVKSKHCSSDLNDIAQRRKSEAVDAISGLVSLGTNIGDKAVNTANNVVNSLFKSFFASPAPDESALVGTQKLPIPKAPSETNEFAAAEIDFQLLLCQIASQDQPSLRYTETPRISHSPSNPNLVLLWFSTTCSAYVIDTIDGIALTKWTNPSIIDCCLCAKNDAVLVLFLEKQECQFSLNLYSAVVPSQSALLTIRLDPQLFQSPALIPSSTPIVADLTLPFHFYSLNI